jgi:GT2 family glycosyltransferase
MVVVLCSRDRPALLRDALVQLRDVLPADVEVIVVDSASTTSQTQEAAREFGFRTIRVELPGVSRAKNAGIAATRSDIVLLTDDDCRPQPGWAEAMRAPFDDPEIGFVFGNVVATGGSGHQSVSMDRHDATVFRSSERVRDIGHGANFAIRRTALDRVGPFDEQLGPGADIGVAEDVDMYWRLLRAGWVGRMVPESVVHHESWRDLREMLRAYHGYGAGQGAMNVKARALGARLDYPTIPGQFAEIAVSLSKWHRREALNKLAQGIGQVRGTWRARRHGVEGELFRARA